MTVPQSKARVFSGMQPSGEYHIGNWLGAVRTWAQEVAAGTADNLYCIVDAHAITVPYEPKELKARTLRMAMDIIASGVDPERCTLFVQSDVREHMELAWYLASVTPMGDLGRMTQFKDKSEGKDFVSTALFTYPVLMSADIMLYKASIVPVGDDQLQHLELARETVRRFNHRYGNVFPEPKPRLSQATRIMGLDGDAKMSKSKGNSLGVFEDPKVFWKKLSRAYTDPTRLKPTDPGHPDTCNIYTIHKAVSSVETVAEVRDNCTGGKWGCFHCKEVVHKNLEAELVPLRLKRAELSEPMVQEILHEGAKKARSIAQETMREVRDVMGLGGETLG